MNADEEKSGVDPGTPNPLSGRWERTLVLVAVTALGLYTCFRLTAPFLSALAWAVALAVLTVPLQRWLERRIKRPSVAAGVAVIVTGLAVLAAASFVGQRLITQVVGGAQVVESKISSGEWRRSFPADSRLARLADWIEPQVDLPGIVKDLASWLSTAAGSVLKGSVFQAAMFMLTFYLLFFFLRDREPALRALRTMSPLTTGEMDRLLLRLSGTISATIYGTLAVSAVQGLLGGLMFWWLGVAAPLLWGVVMALLAVVPLLGAAVVWAPAALVLAAEGHLGKALVLAAWGVLVVSTADNLLRPVLVGSRLKQHTVLAFLSVVGGLFLFGPAGLVLGPITLTITTVLLEIWSERARADAADDSP